MCNWTLNQGNKSNKLQTGHTGFFWNIHHCQFIVWYIKIKDDLRISRDHCAIKVGMHVLLLPAHCAAHGEQTETKQRSKIINLPWAKVSNSWLPRKCQDMPC